MAITTTQQTSIMKASSALFNKAFSPEMVTDFVAFYESNGNDLAKLADALIGSSTYTAQYAGAATVAEFGTILMAHYGLSYTGTTAADTNMKDFINYSFTNKASWATSLQTIQAVDKYLTATFIPSLTTTDTVWGTMATAIENKATVATNFKNNASNAGKELSLVSVTSDVATVTTATATATVGSTFTLTKDVIDTITGTSGNDTIVGDANTSAADTINGGAGTDTLKLYGNAVSPVYSAVEVVYLNGNTAGFDVSTHSDVTTLQLDGVATGQIYTIANGQAASIANEGTVTVDFAGNTVTSLSLNLNAAGSTTAATTTSIDFNSTAQTALSITTVTAASNIAIINTGAKITTLNVAGDKAIAIDADTNTTIFTTVNAASNTGGVTIVLEDDTSFTDVTVTGGTGNDTANFGAKFTKADKFDGGNGTDTLAITSASLAVVAAYGTEDKATVNTNLANIETLMLTDVFTTATNTTIDVARFDGVNNVVLLAGYGVAGGTTDHTITGVVSGVTVTVNDAATDATDTLSIDITDATVAGHNSDIVNLVLNDAAAGGASDIGLVDLVGVDTLNISTASTVAATGVAGTTTSYTLDIANTSTALDKIVVTGNIALDISTVALVNSIAEVDASGMTLTAVTSNGLTASIAAGGTNGVFITGSMGIDTLVGSAAADVINGGTGADIITGSTGADTMTGGAGNDTFNFADADSGITAATADVITDYTNTTSTSSSDKLVFTTAGGVIGSGTGVTGFTVVAGVATKAGATVQDFLTAAALADTANEVYAFVSGSDTYVYFNGVNDDASTADDVCVKLTGTIITSVVTTDTVAANELFIA